MTVAPSESIVQWFEIISALGIVFLTTLLVLLYKRQQQQLAANHEAILHVSGHEWEKDDAEITLSNFGNGMARYLTLTTLVFDETGGHREHSLTSVTLTRADEVSDSGKFDTDIPNHIQPGEKNIVFHGRSKIGVPAATTSRKGSYSISFSQFIRKMKKRGSGEVKYKHIVHGSDLSGKGRFGEFYLSTRAIDPQKFDNKHSLENPPGIKMITDNSTFAPYFFPRPFRRLSMRVYVDSLLFLDSIIPKLSLYPRPLDASGLKRVKRFSFVRRFRRSFGRLNHFRSEFTGKYLRRLSRTRE